MKITLYDCYNAKAPNGLDHKHIYCSEGYKLGSGYLRMEAIDRGAILACRACQRCKDLNLGNYPLTTCRKIDYV